MDMNCFRLVCVVSRWLRVGSVAADSFRWVVTHGFEWLRMVSGGIEWFRVVCCFSSYDVYGEILYWEVLLKRPIIYCCLLVFYYLFIYFLFNVDVIYLQ